MKYLTTIIVVLIIAIAGYFIFLKPTATENTDTGVSDNKGGVGDNKNEASKPNEQPKIDTSKPEYKRFCGNFKYVRDSGLPVFAMPNALAIKQFIQALNEKGFDSDFANYAIVFLKGMDLEPRAWIAEAYRNEIRDYMKKIPIDKLYPIENKLNSLDYPVGSLKCDQPTIFRRLKFL